MIKIKMSKSRRKPPALMIIMIKMPSPVGSEAKGDGPSGKEVLPM